MTLSFFLTNGYFTCLKFPAKCEFLSSDACHYFALLSFYPYVPVVFICMKKVRRIQKSNKFGNDEMFTQRHKGNTCTLSEPVLNPRQKKLGTEITTLKLSQQCCIKINNESFEDFTAMRTEVLVSWVVTTRSDVLGQQSFGGTLLLPSSGAYRDSKVFINVGIVILPHHYTDTCLHP